MIRNQWYIACESRTLGAQPLARALLGEHVVLFRDEAGQPAALADRCSHRHVPLSGGVVENGCLRCPYHGWEFDAQGACVKVPSLCGNEAIPTKAAVKTYPLVEQDGFIWVWIGDRAPEESERPFKLPHAGEPGWGQARLEGVFANNLENSIENFIDTTHTGYIHGGLFRKPASNVAHQHVRTVADGVVIDIDERNDDADSLLGRLLVKKGSRVTHQDRFILPSIVQVAYGFGDGKQIVAHQIFTPEEEWRTRVYVNVAFHMGPLNWLIKPAVPLVGRVILHQDLGVLERQAEVLKRTGQNFTSVPADTANLWIQAAIARAKRGEPAGPERDKQVEYRL